MKRRRYFDYDDEPDEFHPRDEEPLHVRAYHCGGFASWSGPCGAPDCEDCNPGGAAAMAEEERLEAEAEAAAQEDEG